MAGTALCLRPLINFPHSLFQTRTVIMPNPNPTRFRIRNPPRPPSSSSRQNPNPLQKTKPELEPEPETESQYPQRAAPGLLDRIGVDGISLEILYIALPAVLALAADPFASLVDTAFVGHLGSVELAAIGVSVSLVNLVSKLFNVPLLNITTSFVAEQQARDIKVTGGEGSESVLGSQELNGGRKYLPAISTSLALAAGIGIIEAIVLSLGSGQLLNFMGIHVDSPMRIPAEQFLTFRALGAPPVVIALAAQGTFRGFMDTKTPLYAIGAGSFLNAVLDPILIFLLGLGIGGAAISTVISEYVIAFILLWELNKRVILVPPNIVGSGIARYLTSGGLLVGRTIAVLLTMTLATSMAAREGPIPMAGHQICLQVWLAVSLLNDALALAGQALLASEYTNGNYKEARLIVYRVLQIAAVTGIALATLLFFGFEAFSTIFTTDAAVLNIARSGVLFVTASQPINAIAFVFDGLYYGVSDFAFAAYSMVRGSDYLTFYSFIHAYGIRSVTKQQNSITGVCGASFVIVHFNSFACLRSCWSLDWIVSVYELASSCRVLEIRNKRRTLEIGFV